MLWSKETLSLGWNRRTPRFGLRTLKLRDAISELRNKVADLAAKLGQTSKDSSVPPSRDPNTARAEAKQNRAERRKAARKQGKQPGAQGRYLAQVENPDHRIIHRPPTCTGCGGHLAGARVVGSEKRQVFDLPPIKAEVTEHNNAERPLRPAKLHDKISGTFRNSNNAEAFATTRSYIATAAMHEKNLPDAFVELFTTGPWLPPEALPG